MAGEVCDRTKGCCGLVKAKPRRQGFYKSPRNNEVSPRLTAHSASRTHSKLFIRPNTPLPSGSICHSEIKLGL